MNWDFNTPYRVNYKVHTHLAGPDRKLSLPGLFSMFQDAAHTHAGLLGWGYHEMQNENCLWALLRVKVSIDEMPGWDQTITMETWPKDMKSLFASRDFRVMDENGIEIIRGTSLWTVLDATSRKPVRMPFADKLPSSGWENALSNKPEKISWPDSMVPRHRYRVGYMHLDMNWHVNNIRYLEWAMNEFDLDIIREKTPAEVVLNFINEATLGQDIEVLRDEKPHEPGCQNSYIRIAGREDQIYAVAVRYRG